MELILKPGTGWVEASAKLADKLATAPSRVIDEIHARLAAAGGTVDPQGQDGSISGAMHTRMGLADALARAGLDS